MSYRIHELRRAVIAGVLLGAGPAAAWAQTETFTATATVKTAAGAQMTAPVTVVVTRMTTDAERAAVVDALKKGGTPAVVQSLKGMGDTGYIEVGKTRTLVTVVAPTPIAHLGGGLPGAKPRAGFDLALAFLELKAAGAGTGELAPAATVKFSDENGLETQDYGAETVLLSDVQQVKK
jgi:hypothetical protein